MSTDPTAIRSIAVTVDDVVTAYEAARDGTPAVLRVTPPFSGRMRARLHCARATERPETGGPASAPSPEAPVHIDPQSLIDAAAPPYPTPADTEDRLRASDRDYSIEAHHDYHVDAVRAWRDVVGSYIVETVAIETPTGTHTVEVHPLG